jgi:hypothetical protein
LALATISAAAQPNGVLGLFRAPPKESRKGNPEKPLSFFIPLERDEESKSKTRLFVSASGGASE